MSLTAQGNETSIDSIEKAFDNCVYKHDSLVGELTHAKEIISMDSAVNAESNEYIELLQKQVDELNIQIENFEFIKKKHESDLVRLEGERQSGISKEKRKGKFKAIVSGTVSFAGGVGVGCAIVGLYFLLR